MFFVVPPTKQWKIVKLSVPQRACRLSDGPLFLISGQRRKLLSPWMGESSLAVRGYQCFSYGKNGLNELFIGATIRRWLRQPSLDLSVGICFNYASPTSGEAYRDRRLTTNFELWVEIFCVLTCFHVMIPKPCLSVCPSVHLSVCSHPEKRYHHSFVNISPTLVIDTSMERSSLLLHHGNPKIGFFFS